MTREISWILESKRHLCLLAAACVCGSVFVFGPPGIRLAIPALVGGGIISVFAMHKNRKEVFRMAVLTAAIFFLTLIRCGIQEQTYQNHLENARQQTQAVLSGIVYKKEIKANSYLYYLKSVCSDHVSEKDSTENNTPKKDSQKKHTSGKDSLGKILVYSSADTVSVGSEITVSGEVELFAHAANDGSFDLADYYRSQNITCRMFSDQMEVMREPGWDFRELLYRLQKRISEVYETELNDRDAGILGTLALGNQAMMEDEIEELYQGAGISHILAISGLHISILGYGLFRFLRKFCCPYPGAAAAGCGAVFAFALMSGMAVSARRALIMYLLMMAAQVLGRSYDSINALSLATLIVLFLNPQALFQSGFQFSYLSLMALCLASRILTAANERRQQDSPEEPVPLKGQEGRWKKWLRKTGGSLWKNILSGAVLQLFLLPLTAWHYYEVPLYSLFLNLLVIPLCSWLLGFGLLGGITGIFFPEISKWLLIVCHLILVLYEKSIGAVDLLPFSQVVTGKPESWLVLLYYVLLLAVCAGVLCGKPCGGRLPWPFAGTAASGRWGQSGFLPVTVFLALLLFVPGRQVCRVDFLDVSQGDGIYLTDGEGTHVMIDGGSSDEKQVGKYRIEPFLKYHRVQSVDVWIISHADEDHCSGALELMQAGYPVRYLLLAEAAPEDDSVRALELAAGQNGTEVVRVQAGDSLQLAGCRMECLYPAADEEGGEKNALSQVWAFRHQGLSVLFTGDIDAAAEETLCKRGLIEPCTILKAAHHGSRTSSGEAFLGQADPQYTVISAGKDNRYGHPHWETLKHLEEAGSGIWQTMEKGQISVCEGRAGWEVSFSYEEGK